MPDQTPIAAGMSAARLEEIRDRWATATPGPWEPGAVWLTAGVIFDSYGRQPATGAPTHCWYCRDTRYGTPVWTGRTAINGTVMNAHCHRDPDPYAPEHLISSTRGIVAGNYDYESGGIVRPADTVAIAAAPTDIAELLAEVERRGAEVTRLHTDLIQTAEGRLAAWGERDEIRDERDLALATVEELRRQLSTVSPGLLAVLADPGAWHVYCPDGDDEPALHHACPGSPDDEGRNVGRPVNLTLAEHLALAAEHTCAPVDGGDGD